MTESSGMSGPRGSPDSSDAARRPDPLRQELGADGVLRLTIDRPHVLNALDTGATAAMVQALGAATPEHGVRVVVVTGSGRAFCSGADLTSITTSQADPVAIMDGASRLVTALAECVVPVVARVNGPAAGIGMSLALAADLAYVVEGAYLLQSFLSIGLMPDGASSLLLAAAVGRARANEMILLGRRIPAVEAAETGLVAGYAPTESDLDLAVDTAAARLAAVPPDALSLTRQALAATTLGGLADVLARESTGQVTLLRSPEFAARARALLAPRPTS